MVRAFISIDFNEENLISKIKEIQAIIKESNADIRFVNPNILHITLDFLGEINNSQISKVSEILDQVNFDSFKLDVLNPDILPNEKHIRVVYLTIKGEIEPLIRVQKEIRTQLKQKGIKVDSRPFKPHLTIGRVKSPRNKTELINIIKKHQEYSCGTQEIASIKLKKSELTSKGPQYSILNEKKAQDKR